MGLGVPSRGSSQELQMHASYAQSEQNPCICMGLSLVILSEPLRTEYEPWRNKDNIAVLGYGAINRGHHQGYYGCFRI